MKIPKIAHFYWTGGPMGWLRRQSIESFRRLNPSWTIMEHVYDLGPVSLKEIGLHGDITRYEKIVEHGGMYFDTDIVFLNPIPDAWLNYDNSIVSTYGVARGVAVLGGRPGSNLFRRVLRHCELRRHSPIVLAYQSFGIKMFLSCDTQEMASRAREDLFEIPYESFFPVAWNNVEELWSDMPVYLCNHIVGIHWFGGDPLSAEYEHKINASNLDEYPCVITQSLRKVLGVTA